MAKKSITIYFLVLGLILIAMSFGVSSLSTTSNDQIWKGYGGTMLCGYFYSSQLYDYEAFANYCEGIGYDCTINSYLSNVNGHPIYEVSCQEYCYSCENGEEWIWAVAPSCVSEGLEEMTDNDVQTYLNNPNAYNPGGSKDFGYCETPTTTCYTCSGENIIDQDFEGTSCPSGWKSSVSNLNCAIQTEQTTCYSCSGGSVQTVTFDSSSCPSGWSKNSNLQCEPTSTTCYSCQNNQLITQNFYDSCPIGWETTQPNCQQLLDEEPELCYSCQDGLLNSYETSGQCISGWSTELKDCSSITSKTSNFFNGLFDYKNNTFPSVLLTIGLFISFASIVLLWRKK